jgi:hypothetical protein
MSDLAILANIKSRKRQHDVKFIASPGERAMVARVTHRIHRSVDEHDEMVADLMSVLHARQRIEQPLPLRHARRWVRNFDLLQQPLDLRATQTTFGIGKDAACGL